MSKTLIIRIIKSFFITIAVAITISFFLTSFQIPFFNTFFLAIGLQFLFFYFYGDYVIRRNRKLQLQAELKVLEETSKQKAQVICPCDREIESLIPVDLSKETNYHVCPGCDKNISIYCNFKTALATNPINLNIVDTEIIKKVKNDTI